MREATGGALLLYLIIPVLFLFVAFIGFIMNYASAYRAANYIVTQIETCDGTLQSTCGHTDLSDARSAVKSKYGYYGPVSISCKPMGDGAMYTVSLEVNIELPIVGKVPPEGNGFKIVSETKTLHYVSCGG